jgi:hypothetical protein
MCTYISASSHARHAAASEPRRWQGTNGIRVGAILDHLCTVNTFSKFLTARGHSSHASAANTGSVDDQRYTGICSHRAAVMPMSHLFTVTATNGNPSKLASSNPVRAVVPELHTCRVCLLQLPPLHRRKLRKRRRHSSLARSRGSYAQKLFPTRSRSRLTRTQVATQEQCRTRIM